MIAKFIPRHSPDSLLPPQAAAVPPPPPDAGGACPARGALKGARAAGRLVPADMDCGVAGCVAAASRDGLVTIGGDLWFVCGAGHLNHSVIDDFAEAA